MVPPTASTIPPTPAATPLRAVFGSFIHRREKMNPIAESRYSAWISGSITCPGSRFLNIFSMRSVIRKPLTMLVIEAKTATAPSTVLRVVCCSPASSTAPTMAIAEMALVSDMSGVWSSRETRRMTSNPRKVDSISTNRPEMKSKCMGEPPRP